MIKIKERIVQRSIGFKLRQLEFFEEHPEFDINEFVRNAMDIQIEIIDNKFLSKDKK